MLSLSNRIQNYFKKQLPSNSFTLSIFLFFRNYLQITMTLNLKIPHNYLCALEKTDQNSDFHSIIAALSSSKYKTLLTCKASIYQETLREFWKNANVQVQDKKPWGITSTGGEILVSITPQTISEVFEMNDHTCSTSFPKHEYQTDLTERGYEGQMDKTTLQKGNFPPPMKFLFHTLLMCISNKTTAFNEIPLYIQYLGYAIMAKANFNYSRKIFNDIVKNVNNIKAKKKAFLLFPRFLSYYLQKRIPADSAQVLIQGAPCQINSLSSETFTRISESKDLKT
ncbi:hypothetical protein Hanom_Chr05g00427781 [Helianthus anomalus]